MAVTVLPLYGDVVELYSVISVINAKQVVNDTFGKVDILVNGAGNHPKGTTTKEYFEKGDIENPNVVSFFDLSKENFNYVFDLNIVGTLIPTQVFIVDMLDELVLNVLNIASNEFVVPRNYKVSAYCAAKAAISNFADDIIHILQKAVSESITLARAALKQYRINTFEKSGRLFRNVQRKFLLILLWDVSVFRRI